MSDFSLVAALVGRVNGNDSNNICSSGWQPVGSAAELRQRPQHQSPPLAAERFVRNRWMRSDGVADVRPQRRHVVRQLHGDGCGQRPRRLELAAAAHEEEAGAESPLVGAAARNRSRNGRLSRARHAVEPVEARAVVVVVVVVAAACALGLAACPRHHVAQHLRARVRQAQRIAAAAVVVEGRMLREWKLIEQLRAIGRRRS
jgi:hypothetical protein